MPEFIGLLDRERLAGWLAKRGVDPAAYSLEGGHPSERYVLDQRGSEWVVFYSERGLETGLRSFQSEDLACRHLDDLLWKDHTVRPERGKQRSFEPRTSSLSGKFCTCSCFHAVNVEQLLAVNPAARSKRPKISGSEPVQIWSTGQLDSFLTIARSHRLFAFYRLAAYTGARRGELLYLRWRAVDLDAAEVTLGGSTAVVRGQRVEGTTKGGRSRTISVDSETVTVLRGHHRLQTEERQAAGSAWTDSGGLIFTSRWGEPLYPDTVIALMGKLISEHNKSVTSPARPLPHARLHDLRHLHATTLLLAGVPVHVVAARLGHADPAVTLRVYSHVLREHTAGVGDIFAQAVKAPVSKSVSKRGAIK